MFILEFSDEILVQVTVRFIWVARKIMKEREREREREREEGGVRERSRGFSRSIFSKRVTGKERGMGGGDFSQMTRE